ncbi:MAG: hypothetical protein PHS41_08700, partial [Victivallaceae bacterium]|nr:hypothetical protein [Victivallaceae bacterium]
RYVVGEMVLKEKKMTSGKQALLTMLQKKYGTIGQLNAAWGSHFCSWETLQTHPSEVAKKDLGDYSEAFVERLFRCSREAVKSRAPNLLYLGSRLMNDDYFQGWLNQLAAKYCDVVSYNLYPIGFERFRPAGLGDVPVLISESAVGHAGRGTFGTIVNPGSEPGARTRALTRQLESALRHPQIVGIHHFNFKDQVLTGRWDGENYGFGVVDITVTPYEDYLKINRKASELVYDFRAKENQEKVLPLP